MVSISIDALADVSHKRNVAKKEEGGINTHIFWRKRKEEEKKKLSQDPAYIGRESEP